MNPGYVIINLNTTYCFYLNGHRGLQSRVMGGGGGADFAACDAHFRTNVRESHLKLYDMMIYLKFLINNLLALFHSAFN